MNESLKREMQKIVDTVVKSYQTDFVYDQSFLEANPEAKIIWSVYPCGTAIFRLWSNAELPGKGKTIPYMLGRQADREIIVNSELYGLQYVARDKEREFFVVDQNTGSIRKISATEAVKIMTDHIDRLKKMWATH